MGFIEEVNKKLDMPDSEKENVIVELKSHIEDIKSELIDNGMSSEEAQIEAEKRMGDADDVANRMGASHCIWSWKSVVLAIVPFFVMIIAKAIPNPLLFESIDVHNFMDYYTRSLLIYTLPMIVFLTFSIRELIKGRRSIWVATWLAAGINAFITFMDSSYSIIMLLNKISFLPPNPNVYTIISTLINIAFSTAVLILMSWKHQKVRKLSIVVCTVNALLLIVHAIYIPKMNYTDSYIWILFADLMFITEMLYTFILAYVLFSQHKHGNPLLASLFIFAILFYYNLNPLFQIDEYILFFLIFYILQISVLSIGIILFAKLKFWTNKLGALIIFILLGMLYTGYPIHQISTGFYIYKTVYPVYQISSGIGSISYFIKIIISILFISLPVLLSKKFYLKHKLRLAR